MTQPPPSLSWPSRLYGRAAVAVAAMPRWLAWCVLVAASTATLGTDLLVGSIYNVSILYLFSLALIAWSLEERPAILVALALGLGSASVQHLHLLKHALLQTGMGVVWFNVAMRLVWAYLLISLFTAMRSALALERWRARTDALTGMLNKAAFEEELIGRVRDARAGGGALVLAYMDLDGFKGVNDRYGHSAGDRVLRTFASAAREAIREADLFARFGGDEFAALLMVRSVTEGDHVAALIHERLSAILAETGMGVTCSTGALVMEAAQIAPADSYVELADKLMYEVKQSGKNALRIGRVDPVGAVLRSAFPPADPQFELPVPPPPRLVASGSRQAA